MSTLTTRDIAIDKSSAVPIYRQLTIAIRAQIQHGDLAPGDKLPSETELARQIGVSPMTVRQAYGELTNARVVERSHGRGTFVLAQSAAPAAGQTPDQIPPPAPPVRTSTDLLLLFTSYSALSYHNRLVDAVAQGCETAGWNLHLSCHRERGLDHQANSMVASLLRQRQIDAVLASGLVLDRDVEQLSAWKIPILLLDHEYDAPGVISLRFDDEAFIAMAVKRLATGGCKRIGLIPGPLADVGSRFRRRGNRLLAAMPAACAAAGVIWHPRLAHPCSLDEDSATVAAAELMAQAEPPDGLIVHGDSAARGARRVLAACGATVPLANFADDPAAPGVLVMKPFAALAQAGLETLRRILARDPTVPQRQVVPMPETAP